MHRFSWHIARTSCLSTGLKKKNNLFEQFAAAVITLDELKFTVCRQSSFAGQLQFKYIDTIIKKKYFRPKHSDSLQHLAVDVLYSGAQQ